MIQSDYRQFIAVIQATAEIYGKTLSDTAIGLYWQALKGQSLDEVKRGISAHIAAPDCGRFMPRPADILRPFARVEKEPIIAWSQVARAMIKHGSYQSVCFEDGVINAVIRDLGGWIWICNQNIDEPWVQKEFERKYEAYRRERITHTERLPGYFEIDNHAKGLSEYVPQPILIEESGRTRLLPKAEAAPRGLLDGTCEHLAEVVSMDGKRAKR
ncbi:MAG: hypothetical protein JW730_18415 [Anaerolineales bacterium]|nr:hypothetical protein [Anaerolineales bacterium]